MTYAICEPRGVTNVLGDCFHQAEKGKGESEAVGTQIVLIFFLLNSLDSHQIIRGESRKTPAGITRRSIWLYLNVQIVKEMSRIKLTPALIGRCQ